jgi:hypothetical protein
MTETGHLYVPFVLLAEIVSKATAFTFCGKAYFLRNVRKASLCLLYCFVRGTLSPSFTPCKGDNIPLDPRTCACGAFLYFLKVNAVALS